MSNGGDCRTAPATPGLLIMSYNWVSKMNYITKTYICRLEIKELTKGRIPSQELKVGQHRVHKMRVL